MECRFYPEIIEMQQYGTLGNMCLVRPLQLDDFLKRLQGCVWFQNDISLTEHSLVGPLNVLTTGINKLKYPIMINKKQWKALEK